MASLVEEVIEKNGGNLPKSEDESAFAKITKDGVPRPDTPLNTLRIVSLLGGLFGADYFYLGSIKNGALKLVPALITGILTIVVPYFAPIAGQASFYAAIPFMVIWLIWYILDVTQVFFESDFLLKFGMSLPFNLATGVGQGRITDKTTVYETKSNFGIWAMLNLLLWPTGLHNLVFKNVGAFMLQAITLAICIGLGYYAYGYYQNSDMFDTVLYGLPAIFIACVIMFGWGSSALQIIIKGSNIIKEGMQMDTKTKKVINGAIDPLADSNNAIPASQKQSVKDDTYITPTTADQMKDEFQARHPSEIPKNIEETTSGSYKSLVMLLSGIFIIPAQVIYDGIRELVMGIYYIFVPTAAITNKVINEVKDVVTTGFETNPAATMELAAHIKEFKFREAGEDMKKIMPQYAGEIDKYSKSAQEKVDDVKGQAQTHTQKAHGLFSKIKEAVQQSQEDPTQSGGRRSDPLSTESLVLGATALAMIVGGAIKGTVDHLFVGL
jgi:hypothetical protein